MAKTILQISGLGANRNGGVETFTLELARQANWSGYNATLCYPSAPAPCVRPLFETPYIRLDVLPVDSSGGLSVWRLIKLMLRHRPEIVHYHFVGYLQPYAWVARLLGARKIFLTDHRSRPEGYFRR